MKDRYPRTFRGADLTAIAWAVGFTVANLGDEEIADTARSVGIDLSRLRALDKELNAE